MAPADGEHCPDAPPPGRRAQREAERSARNTSSLSSEPDSRPSPYSARSADAGRPSPYAAPGADATLLPSEATPAQRPEQAHVDDANREEGHRDVAPTTRRAARRPQPVSRAQARTRRPALSDRMAARLDKRRNKRTLTFAQKAVGIGAAAAMVFTGAVFVAGNSSAESPMTRINFAPVGTWAWYNDTSLGKTESLDQYAQAQVSGLVDGDHNAGFFLRYSNRGDRVRVAVSGTVWRIEPAGSNPITGDFAHSSAGTFRAEVQGQNVRIIWNGRVVTQQNLQRKYTGRAVVATVWQSSPTVKMTNLEASSLTSGPSTTTTPATSSTAPSTSYAPSSSSVTPSPSSSSASPSPSSSSPSPSPSASVSDAPRKPSGRIGWFSGASGDNLANGGFDRWRGTPAGIAGTWDDANPSVQQELYSICGGQYSSGRWDKPLDIAIGAIWLDNGESWSAAANGAYNDRWRKVLSRAKECWGNRDPGKLFIRFAHELNLSSSDWAVRAGQEGDFARALTQFSNLRYQVFPGAQIVLSVNDGSSGGMADVRKLNPGKDSQGRPTINLYGADSYNAWPHCTSESSCQEKFNETAGNGAPVGVEKHRQLAEQWGVPFSVNEYSNNGDPGDADGGGESPAFVKAFYSWAKSHSGDVNNPKAGQFLYDCLFNMWKQYQFSPSTMQPDTANTYRQLPWGQG